MHSKTIFGHPVGLFVLFFTEMWERFSYYGMRAILILFLLDKTSGLGMIEKDAGAVYGMYTFSVYILSLLGGVLADKVLGQQRTIFVGGIVILIGHIVLAFSDTQAVFFTGLGIVALGTGCLKPNVTSIVSNLYPNGGAKRDQAFSIFYMGINLGGALGIILVGFLGQKLGWHYGFGAAAVGMMLGLIVFGGLRKKYLGEIGNTPLTPEISINTESEMVNEGKTSAIQSKNTGFSSIYGIVFSICFAIIGGLQFYNVLDWGTKSSSATSLGYIALILVFGFFAVILLDKSLTKSQLKSVLILFVIFWACVLFWAGFEQQGSTFNLFANTFTELPAWFPSSWFQFLNSAFIVCLAPILSFIWISLEKKGIGVPVLIKLCMGLLFLALGYFVMIAGAKEAAQVGKVSPMYLGLTYLLHTIGELCLSPVSMSTYTKLAPKQYLSQLMGVWMVTLALGNLFAGLFAGNFDENNVGKLPDMFMYIINFCGAVILAIVVIHFLIGKWANQTQK
ncbi:MAG: peptide MFS transporter [Leadbetterella sp.]